MHVAMIARSYPTDKYKTMGIFEADYAQALAKKGVKVSFLAVDLRSIFRKRPYGMRIEKKGLVTVYRIDWPIGNVPKNILYFWGQLALQKVFDAMVEREGRPDILHALFTDYAYLGARLKEKEGIPLFVSEPNSHINQDSIDPALEKAARHAYHTADKVQTVSPYFQKILYDKFGIDTCSIPVLPDLSLFSHKEKQREKKIVSTGGLSEDKGMLDLLTAFLKFLPNHPEYRLHIFGEGEARKSMEKLIESHGAQKNVILHGVLSRDEIARHYETAEFFTLLSHHETFGLSFIEAWASGLPVLATYCGGPEHLFTKENGRFAPVADVDAILAAMEEMAHTKFDYEGIARWARTHFSEEKIIGDIIEQYNRILKKGERQ